MRSNDVLGLGWGKRMGALALVAGFLFGACSSSEGASVEQQSGTTASVDIDTFVFRPGTLTVPEGTTVRWTDGDDILHTATSGTQKGDSIPGVSEGEAARPDGTFDLQLDGEGTVATFTFEEPGTYDYFCSVHAAMTGRIVVE